MKDDDIKLKFEEFLSNFKYFDKGLLEAMYIKDYYKVYMNILPYFIEQYNLREYIPSDDVKNFIAQKIEEWVDSFKFDKPLMGSAKKNNLNKLIAKKIKKDEKLDEKEIEEKEEIGDKEEGDKKEEFKEDLIDINKNKDKDINLEPEEMKGLDEIKDEMVEDKQEKIDNDEWVNPEPKIETPITSTPTYPQQDQDKKEINKFIQDSAKNMLDASLNIEKAIVSLEKMLIKIGTSEDNVKDMISKINDLKDKVKNIADVLSKYIDKL